MLGASLCPLPQDKSSINNVTDVWAQWVRRGLTLYDLTTAIINEDKRTSTQTLKTSQLVRLREVKCYYSLMSVYCVLSDDRFTRINYFVVRDSFFARLRK